MQKGLDTCGESYLIADLRHKSLAEQLLHAPCESVVSQLQTNGQLGLQKVIIEAVNIGVCFSL